MNKIMVAGGLAVLLAGTAPVSSAAGQDGNLQLVIARTGGVATVNAANAGQVLPEAIRGSADRPLQWSFTCRAGVDCGQVRVLLSVDNADLATFSPQTSNATSARIEIQPSRLGDAARGVLTVTLAGVKLNPTVALTRAPVLPPPDQVSGVIPFRCDAGFQVESPYYRPKQNLGIFVVNRVGNVLRRPEQSVDANDRVLVYVLAPLDEAESIRIRRTSEFLLPGGTDILGAGAAVPGVDRESGTDLCGAAWSYLADFSPGRGEVEVAAIDEERKAQVLSSFDFAVNHLYTGAFSFGPVATWLKDPEFGLRSDSTIVEMEEGDAPDGRYVLAYTHFFRGRRDLEDEQGGQLNPMLAITLEDVFDNVLAGVSWDLWDGSVYVLGGVHGGRVSRLANGLQVGDRLASGDPDEIPTTRHWQWSGFVGANVDLRVAAQMFGKVLGAVSPD